MSKLLKTINIFFYVFLILLSISCGGLGGLLLSQGNTSIAIFGMYSVPIFGWLLISVAILLFVTSFCGCCGTIKELRCCMIMFLTITSIVFIVLIVIGSLLFVYNNQVQNMLKSQLKKEFLVKYGFEPHYTLIWDENQAKFGCCGVDSGLDYKSSNWYFTGVRDGEVPHTCCVKNNNNEYTNITLCGKFSPEQSEQYVYEKGCWNYFQKQLSVVLYWTSISVFIFCGLLALILIFSCTMNKVISRNILYGQVV